MKNILRIAAIAALLFAPGALAENGSKLYIGGGAGQFKIDGYCDTGGLAVTSFSCDDSEDGYKIFVGAEWHENFGGELGYLRASGFPASGAISGSPFRGDSKISMAYIAAVGRVQVRENFNFLAKIGVHSYEQSADASGIGGSVLVSQSDEDLMFGLGAELGIGERFRLRGEWERFASDASDADFLSASVMLVF